MARIYFDSNVFSHLRTCEEEKYQALREAIERYKENLVFFFSHAHICDKKKDSSDFKYKDFEYMETLVGNNYLSYHALKKNTSFYLATPLEVFKDEETENEFGILLDFWNPNKGDTREVNIIKSIIKNLLQSVGLNNNISSIDVITAKDKELFTKMFPIEKTDLSLLDVVQHLMSFFYGVLSEGAHYKELRSLIQKKGMEIPYMANGETYNLKELFNDNEIHEKFNEFVKNSLYHEDKNSIPYYDFYLQAYGTLDLLGFSKDKLTKRNTFNNLLNDGLHSYYARYCDYLVTEDQGLIEKSTILYSQYEVSTKLLSVDQFLEVVDSIGSRTEKNLAELFKKLGKDLISATIIDKTEETNLVIYTLNPLKRYFNFFDQILVFKSGSDGVFVFLTKKKTHYLSNPCYKECQMITDRIIGMFEEDLDGKGKFVFETEVKEMKDKVWKGRYWEIGDTRVHLQINSGSEDFCVQIGPFSRWLFTSNF